MVKKELIATDQAGNFPITSSRGSKYIMAMANINGNAILVANMKSRTEGEMIKAYLSLLQRLKMQEFIQSIRFWTMNLWRNVSRQFGIVD